jgi:precorrin-8X/cobalt-precorrin-8 methylmutase
VIIPEALKIWLNMPDKTTQIPNQDFNQIKAGKDYVPQNYIKYGKQIYDQSFATIRAETNLESLPQELEKLAVRLIHACGMTDIVTDLDFSVGAATLGRNALNQGAKILCDTQMVAYGVTPSRLPQNNQVICTLNQAEVPELATRIQNTRSAAAVELWQSNLAGSIVAIGNAPTALFHLLELLDRGFPQPALILGFPVGFVGAIESKVALAKSGLPFITLHGRRGGSAIAAAAVNALAMEAE